MRSARREVSARGAMLILGAVALVWSGLLARAHLEARESVLDRMEASLLDWRTLAFGPREAPSTVAIAAIDDAAVRRAKAYPMPRGLVAEAVERLSALGAEVVVLDMLFLDPGPPDDDARLATALGAGRTGIAALVDFSAGSSSCVEPIASLSAASATGLVNIALDPSGTVRHVPLVLPCGDGVLPALSLRAVMLRSGTSPSFGPDEVAVGGIATPIDIGRSLDLRYYGPEATISTFSLAGVLAGTVPASFVAGRTVVVGATASGAGDRYPTPFDGTMPGVEIVATAIANLASGDALVRTVSVRRVDAIAAVALALAAVLCLTVENLTRGLIGLALSFCAWIAVVLVGFAGGAWFAAALPLAAFVPVLAVSGVTRLSLGRMSERRLTRERATLAAFLSPDMLTRLTDDPTFLASAVERRIAVVFADISGFTGFSERLGATETRELILAWQAIVGDAAAATRGHVASFMADGAMVIWGLYDDGGPHAARALEAAARIETDTLRWIATVLPRTGPLGIKVGGEVGPAVLSRLGGAAHQHITAIGDTVNVAARLMDVAAQAGVTLAIGASMIKEASASGSPEAARFGPARSVPIRGRHQPVLVCFRTEATTP